MIDSYIRISSDDRQGGDISDARYNIPYNRAERHHKYFIEIQEIILDNGVYPINANNQFVFPSETGGAPLTATLTVNNYTATQFATELATALNAASVATYTVVYDTQTERLTITCTVSFQFVVVLTTGDALDCYDEMGFDRNALPIGTTQVGIGPVKLTGTDFISIASNLGGTYVTSGGHQRILVTIPMTQPFGNTITYTPSNPVRVEAPEAHLDHIRIQLWDAKGRLWPLPNSLKFMVVLKVSREPKQKALPLPQFMKDTYERPPLPPSLEDILLRTRGVKRARVPDRAGAAAKRAGGGHRPAKPPEDPVKDPGESPATDPSQGPFLEPIFFP